MNNLTLLFISAVLMGLGATLTFDLWALLLQRILKITPSSICLVGRWLRYMPEGTFIHSNIAAASKKSAECLVGWIAHYTIGTAFAIVFVAIAGVQWLQRPALIPAVGFGMVTLLAPFLIMQPSFGFGLAASKTSNPTLARIRSLLNHCAFGAGLYFFGWLAHLLLWGSG